MVIECKNREKGFKNTGAKEQCFFGLLIKAIIAVPGFSFATVAEAKDKAAWDTAIAAKQIFPLFEAEEFATANTEPTVFEGRSQSYETSGGKKKSTYSSMLGICSYNAIKSFNKSTVQIFEFTEDGAIKGIAEEDGSIRGQDIVLNVGRFIDPAGDKPSHAVITLNYKDYNQFEDKPAVLRPDGWGASDVFGIFDVDLVQVSASSTVIKLKVQEGCAGGGENVTALIATDFVVKNAAGAVQTVTFVPADSNGVYTLTGTGFVTGHTVGLNGVVSITGANYEAPEVLDVIVT
jgi:hypothetical protein